MINKIIKRISVTNDDFETALASYADLLKESFESNDLEGFRVIYNDYENLQHVHDLIEKFYEHFKRPEDYPLVAENDAVNFPIPVNSDFEILWKWCSLRYALYSWIIYAYSTDVFTFNKENVSKYLKIIENSVSEDNGASLNDRTIIFNIFIYLQLKGDEILKLDSWEWTSRERLDMKSYWIAGVHDWIPYGIAVFLLRQSNEYDVLPLYHIKAITYKYLFEKLSRLFDYFKSDFENWKTILGIPDKDIFEQRKENITSLFLNLNKEYSVELNKMVVSEPLDKERIEKFITKEFDIWKTKSEIGDYFHYFDSIRKVDTAELGFRKIDQSIFIETGKRQFTKNFQIDIIGFTVIWPFVKLEEEDFVDVLQKYTTAMPGIKYSNSYEVVDTAISDLKNDEFNATIIIISRTLNSGLKLNKAATPAKDFQEADMNDPLRNVLNDLVGYYKGIPVCIANIPSTQNLLLVADFHLAFCKYQVIDESTGSEGLNIEVKEIGFDRAKEKLAEKSEDFHQREYGALTDDEAILELQTGIDVRVREKYKFEVLNPKAIRSYNVTINYE